MPRGARDARPVPARGLRLEHATSIDALPAGEWNACLGDRGAFTVDGLRFLERLFGPHQPPENRWAFHYYRVLDDRNRPVLATFFTEALWKDDILAPAEVSVDAEARRRDDPYYATSKTFAMGSLLTEGNHLFLCRDGDWEPALELLLDDARERARALGAGAIVLRDLPAVDAALAAFLQARGFGAVPLPPSMVLERMGSWQTESEFLAALPRKKRRGEIRNKVYPWNSHYSVRVLGSGADQPSPAGMRRLVDLYESVKRRSLDMNTFPLPPETFGEMLADPCWELLVLDLSLEPGAGRSLPVAFVACFKGREHYVPTIVGLDYRYVRTRAAYRQCLWRIIVRAKQLGKARIHFGFGSPVEKARFGCVSEDSLLFHSQVTTC